MKFEIFINMVESQSKIYKELLASACLSAAYSPNKSFEVNTRSFYSAVPQIRVLFSSRLLHNHGMPSLKRLKLFLFLIAWIMQRKTLVSYHIRILDAFSNLCRYITKGILQSLLHLTLYFHRPLVCSCFAKIYCFFV